MQQTSGIGTPRRDAAALVAAAARGDVDTRLAIASSYLDDGTLDRLSPLWDALADIANRALGGTTATAGEPRMAEVYLAGQPYSEDAFAAYDALAFLDAHRGGDQARLAHLRVRHLSSPRLAARLTARLIGLAHEAAVARLTHPPTA